MLIFSEAFCQLSFKLVDAREGKFCTACEQVIRSMPPEVLFGIQINANGDVYFSMNNIEWFDKIFKSDAYGVTVDLVSEDRYACSKGITAPDFSLPRGTIMPPVYRPQLAKGKNTMAKGFVFVKIGTLPNSLLNKKLEGNLAILNGDNICRYTNFVNLDRSVWQLLPMGLFTDSLVQAGSTGNGTNKESFTYSKRIQVEVPFEKSSTRLNAAYLKGIYDSLQVSSYIVRKMEVRAYSSVEGPENINKDLMQKRADIIVQALKKYQPSLTNINVITAENWLDFFKDIPSTSLADLAALSKPEIKNRLTDKTLLDKAEPLLSKHRKAVVTLYLETKSTAVQNSNTTIIADFNKAVSERNIPKAQMIQKEVADRIMDNRLPLEYINRLEIPATKDFSSLLNDHEVYKYLLKTSSEAHTLEHLLALHLLDPRNGHINYNICALRFFMWQTGGDSVSKKVLLPIINALPAMGINASLVKRMLINYHILMCEEDMKVYNYPAKDSSLSTIRATYKQLELNDADRFSIAKYFSSYAHQDWAAEIVEPRIDKIDVSEDLVFYFINLLFFNTANYSTEPFKKASLNAINLNNKRFCNFFLPNDKGGASMQLLDYAEIKSMYCDACK